MMSFAQQLPRGWVHLVGCRGRILGIPEDGAKQEHAGDYNRYVFHPNGFEAVDIQFLEWGGQGSSFHYADAPNPNLAPGEKVPLITSLLAKKKGRLVTPLFKLQENFLLE